MPTHEYDVHPVRSEDVGPFLESLAIMRALGLRSRMLDNVDCFVLLAAEEGFLEHAAVLSGAAMSAREGLGAARSERDVAEFKRNMSRVIQALGEERWSKAYARGRSMTLDAVVDLALQGAPESK